MCSAGVHSSSSFKGGSFLKSLINCCSAVPCRALSSVTSFSTRLAHSCRFSEIISISLSASRMSGTPSIRQTIINKRRNDPAVPLCRNSVIQISGGCPCMKEAEQSSDCPASKMFCHMAAPLLNYQSCWFAYTVLNPQSMSLNNGLRDTEERNQTDQGQNLYQRRIPQPHDHDPHLRIGATARASSGADFHLCGPAYNRMAGDGVRLRLCGR